MDHFHEFIKKQLLDYVRKERERGVPLEVIEKVLLDAGHKRDIIQEVFVELEKETAGKKPEKHRDKVENDLITQLKKAFKDFMAQASEKDIKQARRDVREKSKEIIEEVIEEEEIIEEKTTLEGLTFFVYLVFLALTVLITASLTDSDLVNVIIGLAPAIVNAFVSFLLLNIADNVPLYMMIPLTISSIFYVVGMFSGLNIFSNMDVNSVAIVNFLLGFFFNTLIVYVRFVKPSHMKKRIINKFNPRKEIEELRKEFA